MQLDSCSITKSQFNNSSVVERAQLNCQQRHACTLLTVHMRQLAQVKVLYTQLANSTLLSAAAEMHHWSLYAARLMGKAAATE
jgi:hypothetical protein